MRTFFKTDPPSISDPSFSTLPLTDGHRRHTLHIRGSIFCWKIYCLPRFAYCAGATRSTARLPCIHQASDAVRGSAARHGSMRAPGHSARVHRPRGLLQRLHARLSGRRDARRSRPLGGGTGRRGIHRGWETPHHSRWCGTYVCLDAQPFSLHIETTFCASISHPFLPSTIHCTPMQCNSIQSPMQSNPIQCNPIQCNALQCNPRAIRR